MSLFLVPPLPTSPRSAASSTRARARRPPATPSPRAASPPSILGKCLSYRCYIVLFLIFIWISPSYQDAAVKAFFDGNSELPPQSQYNASGRTPPLFLPLFDLMSYRDSHIWYYLLFFSSFICRCDPRRLVLLRERRRLPGRWFRARWYPLLSTSFF